jgi:hypothetical protein
MMYRWCLLLISVPVIALAAPPQIGYAQSTGYFKKASRPTLYQPLNMLDAREVTAWCSPTSDPLNEQLTFGFKGTVSIDEVGIYTGNGFDQTTFFEFSRAKKVSLKGPSSALQLNLADQRGFQSISLKPALRGSQFTMEILDQHPAEDPEAPVCITDVVFYSNGKPLNGNWLTQKLKYDKLRAPLLGTWFAGFEGAPDRFLSFYFDGSFRYIYAPYDQPDKQRAFNGDYKVQGNRVVFEIPGKGKFSAKMNRAKSGDEESRHSLKLDGELPDDLKMDFRDFL